jgi:protein TonB
VSGERPSLVERDLLEAERALRAGGEERPRIAKALVATLALHALLLWGRLPGWGSAPERVDAPAQQAMKVQFLQPPPPPIAPPRPPEPERRRVPRPDPTPDEPEPVVAPPAAPPAPPEPAGPLRVAAGQGPGVIRRVEPIYPPFARTARIEGTVVLDAVIRKNGTVEEVTVITSAHPSLDRAAADALKRWRFTPGDRDVIMSLTVNFVLD